jgi:hypothetical protein
MLSNCCVPSGGRHDDCCRGVSAGSGDCCAPMHGRRRYVSKPEKIEAIQAYIKGLRKEIQGAEEQIEHLKSA